jgi:predicted GIY-YIG superfamily endonuclease
MNGFCYVYILESDSRPGYYYIGLTHDLAIRLAAHNAGNDKHTAKYRPWHIKTAIAFRHRTRAAAFEIYLKSPSGRAFAKKRL